MADKTIFRKTLEEQSKKLLKRFSYPASFAFGYIHQPKEKSCWVREIILKHPDLSVKADLTFRNSVKSLGVETGWNTINKQALHSTKEYLTKTDAIVNISQFAERLNYACYKNAYKRHGKKVKIVSAVEGGVITKTRMNGHRKEEYYYDTKKRIHAHLLLSLPSYADGTVMDFISFKKLVEKSWMGTKWGLWQRNIEPVRNLKGAGKYQVKGSLDSLDLVNTFLPIMV